MPARTDDDHDWTPDEDDWDVPEDDEEFADDEPALDEDSWAAPERNESILCPYCREPVYEDAQRCPHCERYISEEDAPPSRRPVWIIAGILVSLAIALIWAFGSLILEGYR